MSQLLLALALATVLALPGSARAALLLGVQAGSSFGRTGLLVHQPGSYLGGSVGVRLPGEMCLACSEPDPGNFDLSLRLSESRFASPRHPLGSGFLLDGWLSRSTRADVAVRFVRPHRDRLTPVLSYGVSRHVFEVEQELLMASPLPAQVYWHPCWSLGLGVRLARWRGLELWTTPTIRRAVFPVVLAVSSPPSTMSIDDDVLVPILPCRSFHALLTVELLAIP